MISSRPAYHGLWRSKPIINLHKLKPSLTPSLIAKVFNVTLFNTTSSQNPDAYQTGTNNSSILFNIKLNQNIYTATDLAIIHTGYITSFKDPRIKITKEKLVLLKPIMDNDQQLALIIFPKPLQWKFFSHSHDGPTGYHMGGYKTLYHIRLRFLWPGLRTDATSRAKGYAKCLP